VSAEKLRFGVRHAGGKGERLQHTWLEGLEREPVEILPKQGESPKKAVSAHAFDARGSKGVACNVMSSGSRWGRQAGAGLVVVAVGCSSSHQNARPSLECGEGTVAEDGKCVVAHGGSGDGGATSDLVCGPGTVVVGNACVPDDGGQGGTDHPGGGSGGQATTARGGDDGSVAGAGLDAHSGGRGGSDRASGGGDATGGERSSGGQDARGGASAAGAGNVATGGNEGQGAQGNTGGSGGSTAPRPAAFECGSRDVTNATVITGAVTQSQTWSGLIHMPEGVSVRNEATISIAPGTKIIVGLDADVEFGWEDSRPTLQALGTANEPILICGETQRSGYWGQLVLRQNVSPESTLSHVLVSDGGGAGAALALENSTVLQGVQVIRSGGYGISAAGFGADSSGVMVTESASYPIWITRAQAVSEIPRDSFLTGNTRDAVSLGFARIDADVHVEFHDLGVPYVQTEGIYVETVENAETDTSVTFDAGVEVVLSAGDSLSLGRASVVAQGTAAAPVVFTGACADPAHFAAGPCDSGGQLHLEDASLTYVEIDGAGEGSDYESSREAALDVYAYGPVTLDHVTISDPRGIGVRLRGSEDAAFSPSSRKLLVESVVMPTATPIEICADGFLYSLPGDTSIPADTAVRLSLPRFWTSGTVRRLANAAYESMDDLYLRYALSVSIEPGVEMRFGTGAVFYVGGDANLSALGTAEAPITFTGAGQYEPTYWGGLRVESTAGAVILDHVVLDHGGASDALRDGYANLMAFKPVSITHSQIQHSLGYGIQHAADDTSDYVSTNSFSDNNAEDVGVF
jgi:hypothetical protein